MINADPVELEKFASIAHHWWDKNGEFAPLHEINPLRLEYLEKFGALAGKKVIDVGCGGGILSESMAQKGAVVTGIDLAQKALNVAKLHLFESGLEVDYRNISAEEMAEENPGKYDVVTCMEMLEHVPDPKSIVLSCARLARPGGLVFFSTLNRNPKSYLYAVLGAEYVLNLLPKGTHDYSRFLKPSELSRFCREARLQAEDMAGIGYDLLKKEYSLNSRVDVNYLMCCRA